jgi:hypothetical protein
MIRTIGFSERCHVSCSAVTGDIDRSLAGERNVVELTTLASSFLGIRPLDDAAHHPDNPRN